MWKKKRMGVLNMNNRKKMMKMKNKSNRKKISRRNKNERIMIHL